MAGSIKDKVAIIGMGCTRFGELWDKGPEDLIVDAFKEAIEDAGIEKGDIEAAWFGGFFEEFMVGKSATFLSTTLKLPFLPVTRVENMCATGSETLRGASYAVASGAYDIALALGVEKLKDVGYGGLPELNIHLFGPRIGTYLPNLTAPGAFAMMATRYFAQYGLNPEEGKKMIRQAILNYLVEAIDLKSFALLERATQGIAKIEPKTKPIIEQINQLAQEYEEDWRKKRREIESKGRETLHQLRISGSAISHINIEAKQEWQQFLYQLAQPFQERLDALKGELCRV